MKKIIILILALTLLAAAQEEALIISKVNKTKIALDEPVILNITVAGHFQETPQIEMPKLDNFEVLSRSSQNQFNINAGKIEAKTELIFMLLPKTTGKLNIGEIKLNDKGKIYKTEVIQIEVTPAKNPPLKKPLFPQPKTPVGREGTIL